MGLAFVTLFYLLVQIGNSPAAQTEMRGRIQGEDFVNLRSGPGRKHSPRAVLKRGDEVTVRSEERGWYLVSLEDQKIGYVSREFVELADNSKTVEIAQAEPVTVVNNEEGGEGEKKILANEEKGEGKGEGDEEGQILALQKEDSPASQSKPWSVVRVLEGKKREILRWFLAAVCVFILGWVCGGNYYLRRDRANRTKLRF